MVSEIEQVDMETRAPRRKTPPHNLMAEYDFDSIYLQKEMLWMVVMDGLVRRDALVQVYDGETERDVEMIIQGMIGNGFFEEINGHLRIHPDFANNCYAILRRNA